MCRKLCAFILLLSLVTILLPAASYGEEANTFAGLYINELMASNTTYFETEYGSTPDWIELWNSSDHDMNLSGLWFSDSKKKLNKFCFPDNTLLAANSYMVLHASGINGVLEGVIQLPFKLSADGETLYLYQQGLLIDTLKYPALESDVSYARSEDGTFVITENPSMGTKNPAADGINSPAPSSKP